MRLRSKLVIQRRRGSILPNSPAPTGEGRLPDRKPDFAAVLLDTEHYATKQPGLMPRTRRRCGRSFPGRWTTGL